jgi:hypothetical protein
MTMSHQKNITCNPGGQRGRGRPNLRWIDEVRKMQEGLGAEIGRQRHRIGMDGEKSQRRPWYTMCCNPKKKIL